MRGLCGRGSRQNPSWTGGDPSQVGYGRRGCEQSRTNETRRPIYGERGGHGDPLMALSRLVALGGLGNELKAPGDRWADAAQQHSGAEQVRHYPVRLRAFTLARGRLIYIPGQIATSRPRAFTHETQ